MKMNQGVFLSLLFVLSGTFNVLVVKWAYNLKLEGSDGEKYGFHHPVLFTLLMFLGEFLCFIIYNVAHIILHRRGRSDELEHILTRGEEFKPLKMLLPSLLETVASILLFTGLYLTYASSFQMIRGSAMIFVGFFSTIFLNQTLKARHWLAILSISWGILDIICMDLQRVDYDQSSLPYWDHNTILTGDLLIIIAEILHAMQYVYEEKFLKTTDVNPMRATGWKGMFGLVVTALLAVCFNFLPSSIPFNENSHKVFDDWMDIWYQLKQNVWLSIALGVFTISCAAYNYVGMAIVKFSSSGNRLLADYLRVYFIWMFVILLEWEIFNFITFLGLCILQVGIVLYRRSIFVDWYRATLSLWHRSHYMDLSEEQRESAGGAIPQSRPADVI